MRGTSVDESLTVAEAAKKLNCSERTVYRLIQKRAISFVKLGYRTVRLSARAVDQFIESGGVEKIWRGRSEWLDRVYKPLDLPLAHAKLAEHIRRDGQEIVECLLQFRTADGRIYKARIYFPTANTPS